MASTKKEKNESKSLEHSPAPTPERAIYGFVLYLLTYVGFGFYLLWALLPDKWLHAIGITYLPQRLWVFLGPLLCVLILAVVLLLYLIQNHMKTPDIDSLDYLTDCHQTISPPTSQELAPLADLSISDVNELLYRSKKFYI